MIELINLSAVAETGWNNNLKLTKQCNCCGQLYYLKLKVLVTQQSCYL